MNINNIESPLALNKDSVSKRQQVPSPTKSAFSQGRNQKTALSLDRLKSGSNALNMNVQEEPKI